MAISLSKIVKIPYGVTQIDYRAFSTLVGRDYQRMYIDELHVPGSVKEFNTRIDLSIKKRLVFEEGVESIVGFYHDKFAGFAGIPDIIELPKSLTSIAPLSYCLVIKHEDDLDTYKPIPISHYIFPNGMNEKVRIDMYRIAGLCQHCGGEFKYRMFRNTTCTKCGRVKDYHYSRKLSDNKEEQIV